MIGVKIYATVGSEEKVQYLIDNYSIPRSRIFDSRNETFVNGLHRDTHDKGVDLILNTLSGDLFYNTWRCVAPFGRLIDIDTSGQNHVDYSRLHRKPLADNRRYCSVDIDRFFDVTSLRFTEIMTETFTYFEQGLIRPLPIAREFDAPSIAEAISYSLPGPHIGRVGIRIRDFNDQLLSRGKVVEISPKIQLDPEASYLLAGGLGGLSKFISTYMAEHGARHLIYLGRHAGKTDADQSFINQLNSMGRERGDGPQRRHRARRRIDYTWV